MRLLCAIVVIINASVVFSQTTHTVTVGVKGSFYEPATISALEGDIVSFVFQGVLHGVTQSSFDQPCSPLSGGFSSGLVGLNGSTDIQPPTWNLVISNASEPIWFFCQATKPQSHCAAGMVGAINPPLAMFPQFESAAKAVTGTPKPTLSIALTGMGAFATESPTTVLEDSVTDLPSPSASSDSGGSGEHTFPAGAVAGGVAGGVVALVIITALLFLLCRRKNDRVMEGGESSGGKGRAPSTPPFKRGISESVAGSDLSDSDVGRISSRIHHQASSSALSSAMENAVREVPTQPRNTINDARYKSRTQERSFSRASDTVTMADAFNLSPPRHPYAQPQYSQEPLPPSTAPERSAANVHEIAKEVITLLRTGNAHPPGLTVLPIDNRFSQNRVPRRLPNPVQYLRADPVPEEPGSPALPRYER